MLKFLHIYIFMYYMYSHINAHTLSMYSKGTDTRPFPTHMQRNIYKCLSI